MGEGWSDFYAFDYLLARSYATNTPRPRRAHPRPLPRQEPRRRHPHRGHRLRPRRGRRPTCVQLVTGDPGGYTYDDVGDGQLGTQVHAAGEAWSQTLFDIREELGHRVTMGIVTEGMRLSHRRPVDARHARRDHRCRRGDLRRRPRATRSGRCSPRAASASTPVRTTAPTRAPAADFNAPPPPGTPTGSIAGTVTDRRQPVGRRRRPDRRPQRVLRRDRRERRLRDHRRAVRHLAQGGRDRARLRARVRGRHGRTGGQTATFDAVAPARLGVGQRRRQHRQLHRARLHPVRCGPGGAIDLSPAPAGAARRRPTGAPADSEDDVDPKEIVIELPETDHR